MRLVTDTNIIREGGIHLRSGRWPLVLAAARTGHLRLCVPEVVIRETVAHYRSEIRDAQQLIHRGNRSLRHLSQDRLPQHMVGDDEIRIQVAAYESWLRETVRECGEILPLPGVDHSVLVDAVLSGRMPFAAGEQGYRDALIWHTVIVAAAAGPLIFVTRNTKDFFNRNGTDLADDLVEDLRAAGVASNMVRPLVALDPVLDQLLPEDSQALDSFSSFVSSPSGQQQVRSLVDSFFDEVRSVPLAKGGGILPAQVFDADIEGVQTAIELSSASARPLGSDGYLILGRLAGRAFIGGIVWGRDSLPDGWEVWDTLGDQQYVAFPQPQPVALDFSARFTLPNHIGDLQIESARLLVDELESFPPRKRTAPPSPGAPPLDQARWVRSEVRQLLDLDARNFFWAVRDEDFLRDLSGVLLNLEPSVEQWMTPPDSVSLSVENLGSILEDPAGAKRMLESLGKLIGELERGH